MMRVVIVLIGLIAGAIAGAVLVIVNPLAAGSDAAPVTGDEIIAADFIVPEYRGMQIRSGRFLSGRETRGRIALADPALQRARASVVLLAGSETLPPALAIRLTALAKDNAFLSGQLATTSAWNVIWPGEGSVFLLGRENYWPLFSQDTLAGMRGGEARPEAVSLPLSSVSAARGSQSIIGASGRFADAGGRFEETATFPAGETEPSGGELRLRLNPN